MAIVQNQLVGSAQKNSGNIIFYNCFDNYIIRAKPLKIKKSKSEELARNRSSFSFAKKFTSYHLPYLSNFFFSPPSARSFYFQFLSELLNLIYKIRNKSINQGPCSSIGTGNLEINNCSFYPNLSFSEISLWVNDFNPDWFSYPVINYSFFTLNCSSFSTSLFQSSFSFFEDVITLPISVKNNPGDFVLFIIQFHIFDSNQYLLFSTPGITSFYTIPSRS
ncbi:MAG: hypothetical protein WCJ74_00965 [bacterium]